MKSCFWKVLLSSPAAASQPDRHTAVPGGTKSLMLLCLNGSQFQHRLWSLKPEEWRLLQQHSNAYSFGTTCSAFTLGWSVKMTSHFWPCCGCWWRWRWNLIMFLEQPPCFLVRKSEQWQPSMWSIHPGRCRRHSWWCHSKRETCPSQLMWNDSCLQ